MITIRCLLFFIIAGVISSCSYPVSHLYYTPAVYFASPQTVPSADSSRLHAGIIISSAADLNISARYRVYKNLFAGFTFSGSGRGSFADPKGSKHHYSFIYYNRTRFAEAYAGHIFNIPRHPISFFAVAGYGKGNSISTVPEYDNSVHFRYAGNYQKLFGNAGMTLYTSLNRSKATAFSLGLRASRIKFDSYITPDNVYPASSDMLYDFDYSISLPVKFLRFRLSVAHHINGIKEGDRSLDLLPGEWRILKTYGTVSIGVGLLKKK
jgi:hypothetical protein